MHDRKTISDDDDLYRRIPPWHYVEKEDRISSAAFKDEETSVNWSEYATPAETVSGFPGFRVGALKAKIPRSEKQKVIHDPKPTNYSHSLIVGKKTQSVAKHLARACMLLR